ncbi:tyrosine-type recombinase/integrase [Rhodoferax sp.]|uniref:tyrosine-type recombinase/integrase n=1 Tax=Rhodoferax sp. TaxID=50421 RepID=UPI0026118094|nr:tyrosine-type recombinase/integrase [Rhodoferax sp.]MDD2811689.1 tyrosine-type recombinase/integrase [Rhodoferax sp.]MDD4944935.1 tyrosine-type recombinase/integrase [Rhodoferax sp.]
MIETKHSVARTCSDPGPLEPLLLKFEEHLRALGYSPRQTLRVNLSAVRHFVCWLHQAGIDPGDVNDTVIDQFANHHCDGTARWWHEGPKPRYLARVRRFLRFLTVERIVRSDACLIPIAMDPRVAEFQDWLRHHRGITERVIHRHGTLVMRMIPVLGNDPATYDAQGIRQVILDEAQKCSRSYLTMMRTALRGYLKFLIARGDCKPWLDQAVPTFAHWRLSSLPRYLTDLEIEQVITTCKTDTLYGIRDKAVLLLLARLGLRGGDIMSMRLSDIEWDQGTLRVSGKGHREVRLPLPQDAGDALFAYLDQARPTTHSDRVFVRLSAPFVPFVRSCGISAIVQRSLEHAGILNPPSWGANLLRHSAATSLLRAGASLEAVGSVLRHQSPNTTAHYAKVDVNMLSQIAQPWPGDEHAEI